MIQQTSINSFLDIYEQLGKRQMQVYGAIRKIQPATNTEISEYLHLPINSITPRTLELRKKGLVVQKGIVTCRITKKKAIAWKVAK